MDPLLVIAIPLVLMTIGMIRNSYEYWGCQNASWHCSEYLEIRRVALTSGKVRTVLRGFKIKMHEGITFMHAAEKSAWFRFHITGV